MDKIEEQKEVGEEGKRNRKKPSKQKRVEVLEMFDSWYGRLHKLKRNDRLGYFLNAVTSVFDPHTNYFKPIDKENFNISFSGRLEGIGARLLTDKDYTKVASIVVVAPPGKVKNSKRMILSLKWPRKMRSLWTLKAWRSMM